VRSARWRLVSLWISQTARGLADNCLRIFVVFQLARLGTEQRDAAWPLVTFFLMLPSVFLAPFNGALANSLPKPGVLIGAAAYCLGVVVLFAILNGPWLACWALVALGSAVYAPVRYALLPAGSEDTRLPLTRINGWIELGIAAAIVAGLVLGVELAGIQVLGMEAAVVAAALLNLLGLLGTLPVRFPSDVRRAEAPGQAVAGFFRDARRILADTEARGTLLGLAALRGLLTALTCAVVASALAADGFALQELVMVGIWTAAGVGLGSFLAGLQRHARRVLGLVPLGAAGMFIGLLLPAFGVLPAPWLCLVLGVAGGLVNVPLAATYQASLQAHARGNGMAVRGFADYVCITITSVAIFILTYGGLLTVHGQFWLIAALAGIGAGLSWWLLFRELMEQVLEIVLWPWYRIRAHGPGLQQFPSRGPVLVVANHSAWSDPMWLAKVLPRRIIPMMTSVFYDLPVMRWLMVHVAHAIRVQASTYRREAPELAVAVAALDRGECVVIFPEGAMRRRDKPPLRQFGQGVWHILSERPDTPVVVCWIEGGWGCYFSYFNGKPTKNKRMDFWRRIDVAVGPCRKLSPDLVKNQRATRSFLMQECLQTRSYLGLPPLSLDNGSSNAASDRDKGKVSAEELK
jgi:1-acyl-sn-glycerol-3-phosphate acyltransferase